MSTGTGEIVLREAGAEGPTAAQAHRVAQDRLAFMVAALGPHGVVLVQQLENPRALPRCIGMPPRWRAKVRAWVRLDQDGPPPRALGPFTLPDGDEGIHRGCLAIGRPCSSRASTRAGARAGSGPRATSPCSWWARARRGHYVRPDARGLGGTYVRALRAGRDAGYHSHPGGVRGGPAGGRARPSRSPTPSAATLRAALAGQRLAAWARNARAARQRVSLDPTVAGADATRGPDALPGRASCVRARRARSGPPSTAVAAGGASSPRGCATRCARPRASRVPWTACADAPVVRKDLRRSDARRDRAGAAGPHTRARDPQARSSRRGVQGALGGRRAP
jgi:hypothetical protein